MNSPASSRRKPLLVRVWNALRNGFRLHGIAFPFVACRQFATWTFRSRIAPRTYVTDGLSSGGGMGGMY